MIKEIVSKDNLGAWFDKLGIIEAGKINPVLPTNELTPVGYIPTATGNVLNRNSFIEDSAGDKWFIDYSGDALKISGGGGSTVAVADNSNGTVTINAGSGQVQDAIRPIGELVAATSIDTSTDKMVILAGSTHKSVDSSKVLPLVNATRLTYNPASTGNPSVNYNQFVEGLNGKTYFIDATGKSVLVDATIAVKATLSPVKDFTAAVNLSTLQLAANDGDAWIVTDGTNKGDIATWDALNSQWLYYAPANNEYTTVTTGANAGTSWFYQSSTDTWIQDSSSGAVTTPPVQPTAGNFALPSSGYGNSRHGPVIIQNNDLTAWGSDDDGVLTSGDDVSTRIPHRVAWNWNALNTIPSRSAGYIPKFVDYMGNHYATFAVDHKGKLWTNNNNQAYSGSSMTQNPHTGMSPVPFFQSLNEKIVGMSIANWGDRGSSVWTEYGNVYSTGQNTYGEYGNGTTVANTTSWVKMNLPQGNSQKKLSE